MVANGHHLAVANCEILADSANEICLKIASEFVMRQKPEPKSKGTVMSDKYRKRANTLSAEERQELMGKALELIYRGAKAKVCAPPRR